MQRISRLYPSILLALSCPSPMWAQAVTDIYVAELAERGGRVVVGPLTNATDVTEYVTPPVSRRRASS